MRLNKISNRFCRLKLRQRAFLLFVSFVGTKEINTSLNYKRIDQVKRTSNKLSMGTKLPKFFKSIIARKTSEVHKVFFPCLCGSVRDILCKCVNVNISPFSYVGEGLEMRF